MKMHILNGDAVASREDHLNDIEQFILEFLRKGPRHTKNNCLPYFPIYIFKDTAIRNTIGS